MDDAQQLEQRVVFLEALIKKLQGKFGELITAISGLELQYENVVGQLNETTSVLEKLKVDGASE